MSKFAWKLLHTFCFSFPVRPDAQLSWSELESASAASAGDLSAQAWDSSAQAWASRGWSCTLRAGCRCCTGRCLGTAAAGGRERASCTIESVWSGRLPLSQRDRSGATLSTVTVLIKLSRFVQYRTVRGNESSRHVRVKSGKAPCGRICREEREKGLKSPGRKAVCS